MISNDIGFYLCFFNNFTFETEINEFIKYNGIFTFPEINSKSKLEILFYSLPTETLGIVECNDEIDEIASPNIELIFNNCFLFPKSSGIATIEGKIYEKDNIFYPPGEKNFTFTINICDIPCKTCSSVENSKQNKSSTCNDDLEYYRKERNYFGCYKELKGYYLDINIWKSCSQSCAT